MALVGIAEAVYLLRYAADAAPQSLPRPGGPLGAPARADRGAGSGPPGQRAQPDGDRGAHGHVPVGRRPSGERGARRAAVDRGALRGRAGPHRRLAGPTIRGVPMTRPTGTWPPQPLPPEPPRVPRSPWQRGPRPAAPGTTSMSVVVGAPDWLAERLLEQRMVTLSGELDTEAVNRTVAELALLDATGDEPVRLRLSGVRADLDAALTLVDALDLVGAPVHATFLGTVTGAAVAVLAVADRRTAGAHAMLHLCEPHAPRGGPGREIESLAAEHVRRLRRLQERLAEACGRDVDEIAGDMRTGRLLSAEEAQEYGLVDR